MLKYSCVSQLNGFSIYDNLNENIIGIGLYFPSNYFNHSNDPNCFHYFYGN